MRALLSLVEEDFATRGPLVRARWDRFEADLGRSTTEIEAEATALGRAGRPDEARRLLTDFMVRSVDAWLAHAGVLAEELRASRAGV
jgi:hypothetical protein